jgi:rod shape-determining protein MreD
VNDTPTRVWLTRTVLVGLIVLSLQMTIATEIRPFGVVIQVMLAFTVAVGAASGPGEGATAGFVLGLMYDLATGLPLGSTAMSMAFGGYVAGWGRQYRLEPTWWMLAALAGIGAAVGEVLVPVVRVLTGETGVFEGRIAVILPVVAISAGLLSPLFIPIARWALVIRPTEIRVADADTRSI